MVTCMVCGGSEVEELHVAWMDANKGDWVEDGIGTVIATHDPEPFYCRDCKKTMPNLNYEEREEDK